MTLYDHVSHHHKKERLKNSLVRTYTLEERLIETVYQNPQQHACQKDNIIRMIKFAQQVNTKRIKSTERLMVDQKQLLQYPQKKQ